MDFNDIAKQIALDMSARERRLRDLTVEEGKLRLQIDNSIEEREAAKAETQRVKSECDAKIGLYRQELKQAESDLSTVLAHTASLKAAWDIDKDAHKQAIAHLKAEYAQKAKSLRDDIDQLIKRRNEMKADEQALVKKWSE